MNSFENINNDINYKFYIYDVAPYSFDELKNGNFFGSDGKLVQKSDFSLYNIFVK